ncbi:hypothetical protein N9A89_07215 [Akkermansiaceae bacterium]|nr:hypothetical protein [Akkermansiaceae bacterium]
MKKRYKFLIAILSSFLMAIIFMVRLGEGHSVQEGSFSFLGRLERALYDLPRLTIATAMSPTVLLPVGLYGEEMRQHYRTPGDYSADVSKWQNEGRIWGLAQGLSFWWPFMFLRKSEKIAVKSDGSE